MKKFRFFVAMAQANWLQMRIYASMASLLDREERVIGFEKDYSDELSESSCFVAQAMNFFLINPLDSTVTAMENVRKFVRGKKYGFNEEIFREENFDPARLIAAVALLFREIKNINFCSQHLGDEEFNILLKDKLDETAGNIMLVFPELSQPLHLFLITFEKKFLSPWNRNRWSNYQNRANFTTGVDLTF